MFEEILPHLQCPYCHTALKIEEIVDSRSEKMFAILKCDCDVYPVFDGIAYLKKDEGLKNRQVVELLRERSFSLAFKFLIQERKKLAWIYSILFYLRAHNSTLNKNVLKNIFKLFGFIDRASKDWYDYCFNRKKRVIFKICEATSKLVKPNTLTLDCGSGIGHFIEVLNTSQKPAKTVGLDYSFKLLYLSRLFIADNRNLLICSDLNYSLPFKKDSFQTIFFNDCFMYIFNQEGVFKHSKRVLSEKGSLIINHIHLPGKNNLGSGYVISLALIKKFAKEFESYINSDKNLFFQLKKSQKLSYSNIKNFIIDKQARSVSLILKKAKNSSSAQFSFLPQKVNLKMIDYTEELDFR